MTSTKSNSNGHSDLYHSTTSINLHCGNQNPPHERKKKKKKGPATTFLFQITKQSPSQSQNPNRREERRQSQNPDRWEERRKTARQTHHAGKQTPSKTHTHTPKPTMANLHKSKPIMLIHCTTTHYDPDPQPTIPLPPYSTHNPQPRDPRLSQSEITNP